MELNCELLKYLVENNNGEDDKEALIFLAVAKAIARRKDIVILPYGKYGKIAQKALNEYFEIKEKLLIDNYKADGKTIFKLSEASINFSDTVFLLTTTGSNAFSLEKELLRSGADESSVIKVFDIRNESPAIFGKKYYQMWNGLFHQALTGMNIGTGGNVEGSGETVVFEAVKKTGKNTYCIFDVGANIGIYTDLASRAFPNSDIYSFEPAESTFKALKENIGMQQNVTFENAAVSDKECEKTLYYDKEGSGLASLFDRQLDYLGNEFSKSETVNTVTLDKYCDNHDIQYIDLLKMDIEGNEYYALRGAERLLNEKRIYAIQIEFGGCNIDSRTYFRDFWNLLHDKYNVYRILRDGLVEITRYEETLEVFITTNYLFVLKDG